MSLVWSDEFDDEEELKRLSGVRIRELYFSAPQDKKPQIAKIAAKNLDNLENKSIYDVLGNLKVVTDHNDNTTEGKVGVDYNKVYQTFIKKNESYDEDKNNKNLSELSKLMDVKTLLNIVKISASKLDSEIKNSDNYKDIETNDALLAKGIEEKLKDPKAYSPDAEERFYDADSVGTLDNVSEDAKKQFLMTIAKETGWEKATKESIIATDKKLFDNITPLDVYIEKDGKKTLNPLFSGCVDLGSKISYEFPEGTDEKNKENLTVAYNQQLMANALQRATHDVLKNPSLLGKGESKEEIEESFKNLIADNFSRSVVVAGLATSPNTTDGITIDKATGRVDYDKSDALASEIEEILKGQRKISPLAVSLDTHQLGIETSRCEKVLKTVKNVDTEKLPFYKKVLAVGKTAWNNVVKQGGWKKIAVNGLMFGGAAMAMASGAAAVVATGSAVYAGWTAANAWVAPVWDKLSAEMREKKITGFKNRLAYRLSNWDRARDQKYAEPGFKERAAWRTVEGVTIGGVTAALGLGGATGWAKTLIRQGAMIVGKSSSLTRSWFKKKTAAEKLAEQYSVANYQALQTAEGYLKQDKVALAAVVGGSLLGDAVKLGVQEGVLDTASLNDNLTEVTEKVKGIFDGSDETPVEEVVETNDIVTNETENDTTPEATTDGEAAVVTEGEKANVGVGEYSDGYSNITIGDETVKIKLVDEDRLDDLKENIENKFAADKKLLQKIETQKDVMKNYQEAGVLSDNASINDGTLQDFYDAIKEGRVTTLPKGMSSYEYIDRLSRLIQFDAHPKACIIMIKDMLCDDFTPKPEDQLLVAKALNDIEYENGYMQYVKIDLQRNVIYDENGNPCIGKTPRFGNYVGPQKHETVTLADGTTVKLPRRFSTQTTHIGVKDPCDNIRVGKNYIVNDPGCGCAPEPEPKPTPKIVPEQSVNGENLEFGAEKDVVAPKENVEVNMEDPYAKATAIRTSKGTYYKVEVESVDGKAHKYEDGALQVWDKSGNTVIGEEDYEGVIVDGVKGLQVSLYTPKNLINVVNNLPNTPTDVVEGEDGSITYIYQFEKGKDIKVVLDAPKEGETERVGHFFSGEEEIIIDKKTAEALMHKMTENTNRQFISTDGDEQSVMDRVEVPEKLQDEVNKDCIKSADNMENPVAPAEDVEFTKQKILTQTLTPTDEQKAQIMSDETELNCVGIKDGKAILEVKGVEGVHRIAVAQPTHVEYNLEAHKPVATVGENGSYSIAITTADEKQMLVTIANGKASTTLDGKPVVLDTSSCETTQNLVKMALRQQNVNMNIDLHTDFTEKVVKAVEKAATNASPAKTIAPVVSQSTGR